MIRRLSHKALTSGMGIAAIVGMLGCAQERPPINRVQANALSKSFFIGPNLSSGNDDPEFHFRGYVVDASASQTQIGVGSWSHVDRIRWQVTEDKLIARKSYPLAEENSLPGVPEFQYAGADSKGTVVAAYKITSHFDIRQAYNPQTGEEQNIVEENTTDRPWYERQYMRVDWATNEVENPMWMDMFLGKAYYGNISVTPLTYYVSDPNDDNAPRFEEQDGYFDVTNRFYIAPEMGETVLGYGPICLVVGMLTSTSTYECDAQEATVRFSYKKIDPDEDFEPLENSRAAQEVVGNPGGLATSASVGLTTAPRQGYDLAYGEVDKNYKRFASIHNIWQRSHQTSAACAAKGDIDANGTDDQCENAKTGYQGSAGSQCDVIVGKCTIPYRDRQIKTIGYWVNDLMPAEFQDKLDGQGKPQEPRGAAERVVQSWNQLMSAAVAFSREVECRRTKDGDRQVCHSRFFEADKEMVSFGTWLVDKPKFVDERVTAPVVSICHNPVRDYDLRICGPVGYRVRTGDIRRNMLVYWPYDSRAPWGGIADWNGDPLTGQLIGGMALVMGNAITSVSSMSRDVLQVAMGDMKFEDLIGGVPQDMYFKTDTIHQGKESTALTKEEITRRSRSIDAKHAADTIGVQALQGATMAERMASYSTAISGQFFDSQLEANAISRFDDLVKPMLGSQLERDFVSPSWAQSTLGLGPNLAVSEDVLNTVSPLRNLDPGKMRRMQDALRFQLESRGACFGNLQAPLVGSVDLPGLARYFKDKYASLSVADRGKAIYDEILPEVFMGVQIHEMGHSLGMLHQWASSWDSQNFNPQYWQLRTAEGSVTNLCTETRAGDQPDSCLGPRYLDPTTPDEKGMADESRPGIDYFASTSTMEYQSDPFESTLGLGSYDLHAMKAMYGRVLETYDDQAIPAAEQTQFAPRMISHLDEQDKIIQDTKYGSGPQPVHYTKLAVLQKVFDPARDCRPATDQEKSLGKWRIVHGKVCSLPPKDHAAWQDFRSDAIPGTSGIAAPSWHSATGSVRWFYRFGETHNQYMHTNPFDSGADPYEVAVNTRQRLDGLYPFLYFRRHRREYIGYVANRVANGFYETARTYHWHNATRAALWYKSMGPEVYKELVESDDWLRPYLMANTEVFEMLAREVLMPQPGNYQVVDTRSVGRWQKSAIFDTEGDDSVAEGGFTVPLGEGRYVDPNFASDPSGGGSWDYTSWQNYAAFNAEKALAIGAMIDGRPPVYAPSRGLFLDPRAQNVSFASDMPQAVDRLLAGILAHDWETIAPYYHDNTLHWYAIEDTLAPGPRPDGAKVLFPNIGYNQQLYGAFLGAVYSVNNGDKTLVNKMRVWVEGVDGEPGKSGLAPNEQMRFYNPITGFTYVARRYGTETIAGKTVERGIGARMLAYANQLLADTYLAERKNGELVINEYGQARLVLDANGDPALITSDPTQTRMVDLVRYVGLLDATRQIGQWLGDDR